MKKETLVQTGIIAILAIILVIVIYKITTLQGANGQMPKMGEGGMQMQESQSNVESFGATEVTDTQELSGEYESSTADESVIKVSDGGNATIDGAKVTKSGGDSSNTENSEFYGVNAGILTTEGSTTTIKNATITTDAKGSNAIFATGEDAKVYVSDSTIETTGESSSRGLDATYGGYIEAENVTISTQGGSCASLATDRGEGTVIAKNSTLSTAGSGSPVIYSTGDIALEDSKGTATGAQITVVEGKNSATIKNSTVMASGKGNRNDVDNCAVMIYQSMSGDAGEGTGTFSAVDSKLEIDENSDYYKTAPFFFITNTDAVINLENTTLSYGSNVLISSKGTSEWGNSGSNGGNVVLNATNQILVGDIEVDKLGTAEINLAEKSSIEGTINGENSAKSITLKLDKSSKLVLTGDCYVTELEDEDSDYSNIELNGYKLYVNGEELKV